MPCTQVDISEEFSAPIFSVKREGGNKQPKVVFLSLLFAYVLLVFSCNNFRYGTEDGGNSFLRIIYEPLLSESEVQMDYTALWSVAPFSPKFTDISKVRTASIFRSDK
jgi:hypothetical protein